MSEDQLKRIYDAFSEHYDMGEIDVFQEKIANPDSRKKLFDAGSEHYDMGDFAHFDSTLANLVKPPETPPLTAPEPVDTTGAVTPPKIQPPSDLSMYNTKEYFNLVSNFDPESGDYDDYIKDALNLQPNPETQQYGSLLRLNDEQLQLTGLPEGSGLILKGKNHPTWNEMLVEEEELGNKIIRKDNRYYSVPKDTKIDPKVQLGSQGYKLPFEKKEGFWDFLWWNKKDKDPRSEYDPNKSILMQPYVFGDIDVVPKNYRVDPETNTDESPDPTAKERYSYVKESEFYAI